MTSPLYKTSEFCLLKHYLQLEVPNTTLRRHMVVKTCKLNSLSLSKPISQKKNRHFLFGNTLKSYKNDFVVTDVVLFVLFNFMPKIKQIIVLKSSPVHFNTLLRTQQTAVFQKAFLILLNSFSLHPLFVAHDLKTLVQLMLIKTLFLLTVVALQLIRVLMANVEKKTGTY